MSNSETKQGVSAARDAHRELQQTLHLLAQRLDYPGRIDAAIENRKQSFADNRKKNPAAFFAAIAAVSLLAGGAVTTAALAVVKRFD